MSCHCFVRCRFSVGAVYGVNIKYYNLPRIVLGGGYVEPSKKITYFFKFEHECTAAEYILASQPYLEAHRIHLARR